MDKFVRLASIAAIIAVLSGCGAKGPLFLPEKPVPAEELPAAPADAPESETPAIDADATPPVEPPVEVPATPPADGNG